MRLMLNRYFFIALASATPLTAWSSSFNVNIDTTSLAGTKATLAFDFIDGDGVANNTAQISGFLTDGSFDRGLASSFGDVSGLLDTSVTLGDSRGFNEFLQPLTLGGILHFQLQISDLFDANALTPDAFRFYLLDELASSPLFSTTDPTDSAALFSMGLTGDGKGLSVFSSTNPSAVWNVEATSHGIPVPGTLPLILTGVGSLALGRNKRLLACNQQASL
ncbi:NF038129 family PEP-CTERM protein [Methylomonas rosea]|uniref:NF038129 family PEP-CTERM protein n=1 Tax=Methylomonas rosea TaxID=2952227 RepID=A0ABT1TY63_9GAMM|nr:NF038129 family PEP-CTERM protein [Methylomonas sp. WSC-7]MCQ8119475.1 NF038129 family PEP-CTERM protein [Methylomonas sp. WSC-7]